MRLPDSITIDDVVYIRKDTLRAMPSETWLNANWKELPHLLRKKFGRRLRDALIRYEDRVLKKEMTISDVLNINVEDIKKMSNVGYSTAMEMVRLIQDIKDHESTVYVN